MTHRALFVGSLGPAAVAVMRAWVDGGNAIAAFWRAASPTPGPIRRDRRLALVLPRWSVAALARRHGFPIRDVPRLAAWPKAAHEARATGADALISVYFRYLVPADILDLFATRAVNFHPAPLPRYRGPSPVVAMVLDRSIVTDGAMTLHVLGSGFDDGPIIARRPVAFLPGGDIARYELGLAQAAADLAGDALPRYLAGSLTALPQNESQATYLRPTAAELDLRPAMSADEIRWRCQTLARYRPIGIAGLDAGPVIGFRDIIGPPSGEPPAVRLLSVAFDAADARVKVWRKMPLTSQFRRARRLLDLARTPTAGRPSNCPPGLPRRP